MDPDQFAQYLYSTPNNPNTCIPNFYSSPSFYPSCKEVAKIPEDLYRQLTFHRENFDHKNNYWFGGGHQESVENDYGYYYNQESCSNQGSDNSAFDAVGEEDAKVLQSREDDFVPNVSSDMESHGDILGKNFLFYTF